MANKTYDEQAVIEAIAQALDTFYENLIRKIDDLNINKVMKRKKPLFVPRQGHAKRLGHCGFRPDRLCQLQ